MNRIKITSMLFGIGIMLLFLVIFLESKSPVNLFYSTVGLITFILGYYSEDKKINLTSNLFIALIGVNIIQWLILFYIYYYNPSYLKTGFYEYLFILFILIITLININHRNKRNDTEKHVNKLLEDKTKLLLLLAGIIIMIGCLGAFIIYYTPLFLYGSTFGLLTFIYGYYHENKKLNVSSNYIKAMLSVFLLQWIIIILSISSSTIDDWSFAATFSMVIIIYFLMQLSKRGIVPNIIFKKEEKLKDPDKNTLYTKGKAHQNFQRYQEAIQCYNKALELDPNFEHALKAKEEVLKLIEN